MEIQAAELPVCPVCKKEKACLIHNQWGHHMACCSDECGKTIKARLIAQQRIIDELRERLKDEKENLRVLVEEMKAQKENVKASK